MTPIRSLFSARRPIDRRIEKVIDYAAQEDKRLLAEIEEYEATLNVEDCLRKFLENYQFAVEGQEVAEIGVWLSGFYGSGKSSFTKYLGLALDPERKVAGRPFIDLFCERLRSNPLKALLRAVATKAPTAVIFLDLGAEQSAASPATAVSTVLYWKVLQQLGYSREKKLAQLELTLEQRGRWDEFLKLYSERWHEEWENIHNDPLLGNARAAQVVPQVLPEDFPTPESFGQLRFEEAASIRHRAEEIIALVRKRTGKPNLLILIDEAGQYVASRGELILNLDGLVRDFKELGRGKVWMVATGQQTLTEIVSKALYNSAELNKLQARFPVSIELDARDIKEITYRRLLTKSLEGEAQLKAMFQANGQALCSHTRLTGTSLFRGDPNADTFVQFYPFLPQQFDLLMALIRALARSTGGIGLRSAIKVIQDVLVDVNRLLPPGATRLADRPVGALACVDDLYDILRTDIAKVLGHVVSAVDRTATIFGAQHLAVRVAKAIAVLQNLDDFPCNADNAAALLYPSVGSASLLPEVREILRRMLAEREIGLVEDPKAHGYAFLSDKVLPWQKKRGEMSVTSGDTNRIRNEVLAEVFTPQPSTRLEGTKEVKAAVRSGKFLVVGDGEDITFRLEWVDDARWETRRAELLTETTSLPEWNQAIAWLARSSDTVEDLLPEIYRSQTIAQAIDERNADRDEAQFLRAELKQADTQRGEVKRLLSQALMGGTLVFRGQPTPAMEAGLTVDAAARAVLGKAAGNVFSYYHLAPIRASTDLAAQFSSVERLDHMPTERDPLHLVVKKAGTCRVDSTIPVLAETLRAFRNQLDQTGSGRLLGGALQDLFSGPPYGWSKDTIRYLFAALLAAGEVEFHVAAGTLRVLGPQAAEACKNAMSFAKVGIALRNAPPDPEALDRAARLLEELFGGQVLPLEDAISREVRRKLPELLDTVGALPDKLRLLGLPGENRALALKASLTSALSGDAADATAILGARGATLAEDTRWARDVALSFEHGAEGDVQAANRVRSAVDELETLFPGQGRTLVPSKDAGVLAEALSSERFFERLPDVRAVTARALERARDVSAQTRSELQQSVAEAAQRLEAHPKWPLLGDEARAQLMDRLRSVLPVPAPSPLDDLRALWVRRVGLAALEQDLLADLQERLPRVVEPSAEAEVQSVSWAELTPSASIGSIVELADWLLRVRSRLEAILATGKHIHIGD